MGEPEGSGTKDATDAVSQRIGLAVGAAQQVMKGALQQFYAIPKEHSDEADTQKAPWSRR